MYHFFITSSSQLPEEFERVYDLARSWLRQIFLPTTTSLPLNRFSFVLSILSTSVGVTAWISKSTTKSLRRCQRVPQSASDWYDQQKVAENELHALASYDWTWTFLLASSQLAALASIHHQNSTHHVCHQVINRWVNIHQYHQAHTLIVPFLTVNLSLSSG